MLHSSEEIERESLEELHSVAPTKVREDLGLVGRNIGSAFVSAASTLPKTAVVLNRTIGVGLGAPETSKSIDQIVDVYRSANVSRYFIQVHPEARPVELEDWLLKQGVTKARAWQKFYRGREPVAPPSTDLSIKKIGSDKGNDFAAILSNAFDLGEASRPWVSLLPTCPRWHVFMTYDGDVPAGTGAVFIDGKNAWMDFGATSPAFRRRGSQSSLLRHRVQFALDQGCEQMFTCTGEAVPGDPQYSYANILKAGFKETYLRANYAPS